MKRRSEHRLEGGKGVSQTWRGGIPQALQSCVLGQGHAVCPRRQREEMQSEVLGPDRSGSCRPHEYPFALRDHCRAWGLLNCFTEIEFTYHTSRHFNKVYNSVAFNVFTDMCNHHQSVLEHFHHLGKNPPPHSHPQP